MSASVLFSASSLDPRQIDLWHLDLEPRRIDPTLLSEDEHRRAARLVVAAKRDQFLAARSQLRRILARYLDVAPAAVRLVYGPHGKPALPEPQRLRFNLSHSADRALLAVTLDQEIGIDLERAEADRRFLDLAARFFADDEHRALAALPAADQPAAFYRAWACKEAYLKAWGTGLSFPSNRFSIRFVPGAPPVLTATSMPGDRPDRWQLREIAVPAGYAGALCHPRGDRWLRHFTAGTPDAPLAQPDGRG